MTCKDYITRKLTEEEKEFASRPENHNLIFKYMRIKRLDPEEFYDILAIDYLTAVKTYITEKPELQEQYEFRAILFQRLNSRVMTYYRDSHAKKRFSEGNVVSFNSEMNGNHRFSSDTYEYFLMDIKTNVENQAIVNELFKEFYSRCAIDDVEINKECKEKTRKRHQYTLDLLIEGYTATEIYYMIAEQYPDWCRARTTYGDVKNFRKIFKSVFGI